MELCNICPSVAGLFHLAISSSNPTCGYISKRIERRKKKESEISAPPCRLQHHSQQLRHGNDFLSIHKWMDKENVGYTCHGVLFSLKRERYLAICDNTKTLILKVTLDFWLGQDGVSPTQPLSLRWQMKLCSEDRKYVLENSKKWTLPGRGGLEPPVMGWGGACSPGQGSPSSLRQWKLWDQPLISKPTSGKGGLVCQEGGVTPLCLVCLSPASESPLQLQWRQRHRKPRERPRVSGQGSRRRDSRGLKGVDKSLSFLLSFLWLFHPKGQLSHVGLHDITEWKHSEEHVRGGALKPESVGGPRGGGSWRRDYLRLRRNNRSPGITWAACTEQTKEAEPRPGGQSCHTHPLTAQTHPEGDVTVWTQTAQWCHDNCPETGTAADRRQAQHAARPSLYRWLHWTEKEQRAISRGF